MEIIRESYIERIEGYDLCFEWENMPGSGFSFPCDKEGVCHANDMPPEAQKKLLNCLAGVYQVVPTGVRYHSHEYKVPAQGRCYCGEIVELLDNTNTCENCGLEYNMSGQILAPRSQWEKDY